MSNASTRSKLTLRLDRDLIEAAERYADERGTSVSQLVAGYFKALTSRGEAESVPPEKDDWKAGLSPWTRSLLERKPAIEATEEEYYGYLEEKHR